MAKFIVPMKELLFFTLLVHCTPVFGGGQSGLAQLTTFETEYFSGSGHCAFCHYNMEDETGNDVSNDAHWRSTMMANAAKDPLWQAKVSAEVGLQDDTKLKQVIQEKCSRCHMGMARYQQKTDDGTTDDIFIFDNGFLSPGHYLHQAAMDGVSCTLCHQVQADSLGTEATFTGQYIIDTTDQKPYRTLFGPYENAYHRSMVRRSGFVPTSHAPDMQLKDSAHCGSCHTLYTPSLSETGDYLKEFPEQTTYLEWEHSGMEQTCQGCHMPRADGAVKISRRPRKVTARDDFGQHHFVGGNTFMGGLLKANSKKLGVTAGPGHLDSTIFRGLDLLKNKTAQLTVGGFQFLDEEKLTFDVAVENLAGHKFPSGFPSRRAWLHVTVSDADGTLLFESGKPGAEGKIEGNDADMNAGGFEPHYQKIVSADQVQIYEPVMLNNQGDVTYTLLRANSYAKDNRLLPAGFDKETATLDIGVYGKAADDPDFVDGSDRLNYVIDVSGAVGSLTINVELMFQSLSFPFVRDLDKNNDTGLVHAFMGMYEQEENVPVIIEALQLLL